MMATVIKVRPLGDKILVRREEAQEVTSGGIVLPDTAKEKPRRGRVIAVGDGKPHPETGVRIPLEVKKGDLVLFSSYAGNEVRIGEEEFLIMQQDDVLAVLE
jgi:chaperonin GroES